MKLLVLSCLVAMQQTSSPTPRDPRTQPLTIDDALFRIENVTGRILPVPDADGDGVGDLMIVRGGTRTDPQRIDLVSAKRGATIRTLADLGRVPNMTTPGWTGFIGAYAWDGGGDVDHDGVPDLLIGLPTIDDARGRVEVVSGQSGQTLFTIHGTAAAERFGSAVAFVGDCDGDGRDEFAVGAPQVDPAKARWTWTRDENSVALLSGVARWTWGGGSWLPGFVCLRDGRTGNELWRVRGEHPFRGFGSFLRALGDLQGNGRHELVVQDEWRRVSLPQAVVLDQDGSRIAELPMVNGPVGIAGDLDEDRRPDLFLDTPSEYDQPGNIRFISGKHHGSLFRLNYPDTWGDFNVMFPVGDLDADGYAEIAFGGTNFNLGRPGDLSLNDGAELKLRELTLQQALALQTDPKSVGDCESGCVLVYSGRSRRVLFGVWGMSGTARGLGYEVAPLPDINADGHLDLIIADSDTAYVFAGPGPEKK